MRVEIEMMARNDSSDQMRRANPGALIFLGVIELVIAASKAAGSTSPFPSWMTLLGTAIIVGGLSFYFLRREGEAVPTRDIAGGTAVGLGGIAYLLYVLVRNTSDLLYIAFFAGGSGFVIGIATRIILIRRRRVQTIPAE
jgi:hypothetical protein